MDKKYVQEDEYAKMDEYLDGKMKDDNAKKKKGQSMLRMNVKKG